MPINRNARFVLDKGDVTIELRCGSVVDSEFYFLPDDMLVGDIEISGAFDDDLPIGIPNAITCKLKINTDSFTAEMADLGGWIRTNNINGVPNVWIIYKNDVVDFIGVQEPSLGVKHSIKAKEFELNLTSIHKFAMERISFSLDTPSVVGDTVLDAVVTDYVRKTDTWKGVSNYDITGWGRTKFVNFYPWLYDEWINKIRWVIDWVLRNEIDLILSHSKELPILYKPVLADNGEKPTVELGYFDVKAISEIWESESETFDLDDLKGGLLQTYYQQFKTLWNFYKIFLRGNAKRCQIRHTGLIALNDPSFKPSLGITLNEVFICNNADSPIVIESDDVEATSKDDVINEPYNTYRSVTNRNMVNKSTDVRQIEVITDGGSTAKNRYETFCCAGTHGNTVEFHYASNPYGLEHYAYNAYKAIMGTSVPCTQLLYHEPINNDANVWGDKLKVADYAKIPCVYGTNEFIECSDLSYNNTLFNIDGLDNFNNAINQRQANGYAKLCADIINEVIAKRQTTVNITLDISKVSVNDLGTEFALNIADLYKVNYFYDNIEFGSKAILTNIKMNYTKGTADCTFFIRSDIYAS